MKISRFLIPLLFVLSCLLTACTAKLDIKLNSSEPILVVDAHFSTDTTKHTVRLSKSTDYYEPSLDSIYVSGAKIYIEEIDGPKHYLNEDTLTPGTYYTNPDVYGLMGKRYRLHISNIDLNSDGITEEYEAIDDMPYITERLDSVVGVYGPAIPPFFHPDPNILGWSLLLYAEDPPTKEYYAFTISINGIPFDDSITNLVRMPDDFTQGLYIRGIALYFFPDLDPDRLSKGDSILFEARSISPAYNEYIDDISAVLRPSTPIFGGASSNVRGNITNGAFGCFAVYAVKRTTTILK